MSGESHQIRMGELSFAVIKNPQITSEQFDPANQITGLQVNDQRYARKFILVG